MDYFLIGVAGIVLWIANVRAQYRRILLLSSFLGRFQVEKLMETVVDGYLRALGEKDAERSASIWAMLELAEGQLVRQLLTLAQDFAEVDAASARFSTLPFSLPLAARWLPFATADMRQLLQLHARGVSAVAANAAGLSRRDRAFALTAELMLFQHSCHWFCRSKTVASTRVAVRHQTSYAQVLAAVSGETRAAYAQAIGQKSA